jgi:hypothetical protein
MFKITRTAWHWMRALHFYRKRDLEGALRSLKKLREIGPLHPHHLAFFGLLYFCENKTRVAKRFLEKAEVFSRDKIDNYHRYIAAFCGYLLSLINEEGNPAQILDVAAQIECRPALRRWLPLPTPEEYQRWQLSP